jgi:hypothetical protein
MVVVKAKGKSSPQIIAKYLDIYDFGGTMDLRCVCPESPTGRIRVGQKHSDNMLLEARRDLEQMFHIDSLVRNYF